MSATTAGSAKKASMRVLLPGRNHLFRGCGWGLQQLALKSTTFDGAVHAAFFRSIGFPPPASSAGLLTCGCGSCAWYTTDAGISLIVERMVGHVMGADVVPHLLFTPICQRIDLHQPTVCVVEFDFVNRSAGTRLIAPEPSHPGIEGGEHAIQG